MDWGGNGSVFFSVFVGLFGYLGFSLSLSLSSFLFTILGGYWRATLLYFHHVESVRRIKKEICPI